MQVAHNVRTKGSLKTNLFSKLNRRLLIESIRVSILALLLFIIMTVQVVQKLYVFNEVWQPVLSWLMISFLFHSISLIFFDRLKNRGGIDFSLYVFDALIFGVFAYYTQINQPLFFILYLVNIFLCGMVWQTSRAGWLALVSCISFGLALIFSGETDGIRISILATVNFGSFFAAAYFSGRLSEEINFMDKEIHEKSANVVALKELNDLIVKNISTGLITIDNDNRITHSNLAAKSLLNNISIDGKNLEDVVPEMMAPLKMVSNHLKKMNMDRYEFEMKSHQNSDRTFEIIISPLLKSSDQVHGHVLLFRDLTEIKRLEYNLRQQEKLAAVGQLAAGIAHEIRNPLASISGSVQLISSTMDLENPDEKRLLGIVIKEVDRLNGLISEFLDYVHPTSTPSSPVDLHALIRDVMSLMENNKDLRRDIDVSLVLNSKLGIVVGDSSQLKQALFNLVINAFHAMEVSKTPKLSLWTEDKDEQLVLGISDTGVGIAEENVSKIFEPFHTTKTKGTGLGLALTHKILEAHGTQINVESQVDKGTTFYIKFPKSNSSGAGEKAVSMSV